MNVSNDIFNEQLVKRESNSKDQLKKGGIVFAAVVVFLLVLTFASIVLVPVLLVEVILVRFFLK